MPVIPGDRPLTSPPPGQTPNFAHPQSNAWHTYVTAAICTVIILVFSSLRIYSDLRIRQHRTRDDYTFMLSTICNLVYISLVIALLNKGPFGHHNWELHLSDLKNSSFLMVLLLESLWGPFVFLIKLSLFQMYLHIFGRLRWMKKAVYIGIIVSGLYYLSISVARLAMCAPRGSETYVMSVSAAHCRRVKVTGAITGGFNILSDIYLLILPIPAVLALNNNRRQKLGMIAIFMTGMLAVIASIMGLVFRIQVNGVTDETWKIVPFYLAIIIENTCGLVVLCMPAIAKIIRHRRGTVVANPDRANNNANEEGTPVRQGTPMGMAKLPTLSSIRSKLSRGRLNHVRQSSYDSQAQIRGNSLGSKALEGVPAVPEERSIELVEHPKL